jgi:hypothetical protein
VKLEGSPQPVLVEGTSLGRSRPRSSTARSAPATGTRASSPSSLLVAAPAVIGAVLPSIFWRWPRASRRALAGSPEAPRESLAPARIVPVNNDPPRTTSPGSNCVV